jgi:hypothetical protein
MVYSAVNLMPHIAPTPSTVGEIAVVADAMEAVRHNVKQKAADEPELPTAWHRQPSAKSKI